MNVSLVLVYIILIIRENKEDGSITWDRSCFPGGCWHEILCLYCRSDHSFYLSVKNKPHNEKYLFSFFILSARITFGQSMADTTTLRQSVNTLMEASDRADVSPVPTL
jgi:hypothetical protein